MALSSLIVPAITCVGLLLLSCASEPHELKSTTLADLAARPEYWRGVRVRVEGRLLAFNDPGGLSYGALEDSVHNRIGLKDIKRRQELIGMRVLANGTVRFDPSFGWYLDEPIVEPSDSSSGFITSRTANHRAQFGRPGSDTQK